MFKGVYIVDAQTVSYNITLLINCARYDGTSICKAIKCNLIGRRVYDQLSKIKIVICI